LRITEQWEERQELNSDSFNVNVFGPEVLLVFIGHSNDAEKEARAIYGLEHDFQRELERLQIAASGALQFKTVRCWEWATDAFPKVGGQEALITPHLVRANIALFVFKQRVGKVTWTELEYSRKRSSPTIPVAAFFPANPPESKLMSEVAVAKAWTTLLNKRRSLAKDWPKRGSISIKPTISYKSIKHLKKIVLDQLKDALTSILSSSPANVHGLPNPGSTHIPLPHQLPAVPAAFTGREAELNELETALLANDNTDLANCSTGAVIQGMGGVGKTTLATALAHRLKGKYHKAQIYIDLRGFDSTGQRPLSPDEAMQRIIHVFYPGAKSADTEEDLQTKYNAVLNDAGPVLLFLDNAASAAQIKRLLPPSNCLILATSRNQFSLPGLAKRHIDCLTSKESKELLLKLAPRLEGQAASAAKLCGHLPLALEVFAGVVSENGLYSVKELTSKLRKRGKTLEKVDATFQVSYDLLSEQLRRCWALLAIFPTFFDIPASAAIWEVHTDEARNIMQALLNWSLVESYEAKDQFRLHDLVRAFCNRTLRGSERNAAMLRYAKHYIRRGSESEKLYLKAGEKNMMRGLDLFSRDILHVIAAFNWLAKRRDPGSAALLAALVGTTAHTGLLRFLPRERIRMFEHMLKASRMIGNEHLEEIALTGLGIAHVHLGKESEGIAFYTQALTIVRKMSDQRAESYILHAMGVAYKNMEQSHRAIAFHAEALKIARSNDDLRNESYALSNLGLAYADVGKPRKTVELGKRALRIARKIGNRRGEGNALNSLGLAYAVLHQPSKALKYYNQRLTLAREILDRRGEGYTLFASAQALDELKDRHQAIVHASAALRIFEDIEHPWTEKVRIQLEEWTGRKQEQKVLDANRLRERAIDTDKLTSARCLPR
jgi:tetratricopeptide (TPR) repeat protein